MSAQYIKVKEGCFMDTPKIAGLSKRQSDFVIALIETGFITKAADIAGVTESTAHKWLKQGLNEIVDEVRQSLFDKRINELQDMMKLANKAVRDTLEDEKASRNTKLNAAKIVYDNVFRYNEQRNIIEQMEELRELFKERAL
jgi:phage terminase small subunit